MYYTDGSGGKYSSVRHLRRCGFGVAVLDDLAFSWGAFAVLDGENQSVPRAELAAILCVLRRVSGGPVEIASDSKINVDRYADGIDACLSACNSDLWRQLWAEVGRIGRDSVVLRWIKGHATEKHIAEGDISVKDLCGNYCADVLAERAARCAEVFPQDAVNTFFYMSLARKIQMRAVAILLEVSAGEKRSRSEKRRLSAVSRTAAGMQSEHELLLCDGIWHCARCLQTRRDSQCGLRVWFEGRCVPDAGLVMCCQVGDVRPCNIPGGSRLTVGGQTLHESRQLAVYRGLFFCRRCGGFATSVPKLLKHQCEGVAAPAGRCVLRRLAVRRLPIGAATWPADSPMSSGDFIELG